MCERHAYRAVRVTERGKGTLPRLTILRPNRGKRQFSVGSLKGNVRSAISGLGTSQHNSWKSHVDDFVPHRIQHQLGGGMKLELEHDIASMRFCRFHCHA